MLTEVMARRRMPMLRGFFEFITVTCLLAALHRSQAVVTLVFYS